MIETATTVNSVYAIYQEHAKLFTNALLNMLFTNINPFSSQNSPRR